MQRWTALVFVGLFVASIALVIVKVGGDTRAVATPADAGADAALTDAAAPALDAGAEETDAEIVGELGIEAAPITGPSDGGVGRKLLSGEEPPALSAEAPKSAVFGVVLVTYKGAQGAPANARSRDAALELAKQLAAEAAQDFKATVAKGDKGSMENAGRIPRGILEPAPEYILFSLPKGGVSEPVDTPRGFWIVQRIE